MGWLSNRARRGMTNRAFEQICREVGSAGAGSAMFAVAIAAAVYPDACYGSEDWDQFNSVLPKPIVNPTTAGKISEAWVDHHQMSWDACISKLYGRSPTALLEPSAATTSDRYIDPSTMQSEVGQKIAGQINRGLETSQNQRHRLTQVLDEFVLYTRDFQLDLAEAAIVWAMAALASNKRRDECKSNLHAIADIMYVSTSDAEKTLSTSDRQQIVVAATAVQQHLVAGVGEVLKDAFRTLREYEKENILRTSAELLQQVRRAYLEHAPTHLLPNRNRSQVGV